MNDWKTKASALERGARNRPGGHAELRSATDRIRGSARAAREIRWASMVAELAMVWPCLPNVTK